MKKNEVFQTEKLDSNNIIEKNENYFINQKIIPQKKNNIKILYYISFIKIISCFFVILKHTNENYWVLNQYWVSTNIMTSFSMCGVPLFSLCIGATLLNFNDRYNIYEYWKRRFVKVIIPIMGWNIIFYFYRVYIIKNFKKQKLNFIILYKIYFDNKLYPIISSLRVFIYGYMTIPLLSYVDKANKNKVYSYCLITLLINKSIIPYLMNYIQSIKISWPYNYDHGFIIYLFIGYLIQNYRFKLKFKILIYIFGFIGLLIRLLNAHYLTMKYKRPNRTEIKYLNFPIVIYSTSVFLFIKEYSFLFYKIINKNYINKIGSLTMGPFFLHYIIIWSLPYLFNYNKNSIIYRLFGALFILIICFIITALIKKIPLIKYLVP